VEKSFLIERWLRDFPDAVSILDEASLSIVRERVRNLGKQATLESTLIETVALIATELARNQLSHAKYGRLGVRLIECSGVRGIEVIAADRGPGIQNPKTAIQEDGSTAGTLGAGLSSVRQLADEVDFDIRSNEGTCVWARKFARPLESLCCEIAILGRPCQGESISGDDAVFFRTKTRFVAGLADGLGHGPLARQASSRAMATIETNLALTLPELFQKVDQSLSDTRSVALGLAQFDGVDTTLECGAAGDTSSHLYHLKHVHYFASTPMMLGQPEKQRREVRVEKIPIESGSVLAMFSDGLKTNATLKGELDLLRQPAVAIAQHLADTFGRSNDDVLVLVVRFGRFRR
jgi:anti-sigma regulatory factor (Ser/Thr protein kinase)/serine/threonine protein phosphatase PrpC